MAQVFCEPSLTSRLSLQTEDVTNTSSKLEKRLLLPGCKYEARVRARVSVGQWSHWSPVVTWQTEDGESKRAFSIMSNLNATPLTKLLILFGKCTNWLQFGRFLVNHTGHIFIVLDTPLLLIATFPHISNLLPLSIFTGARETPEALQLLLLVLSLLLSSSRCLAVSQTALCAVWREGGDV